jgi:RNA polymerase sigma factor (sigma-70 family)
MVEVVLSSEAGSAVAKSGEGDDFVYRKMIGDNFKFIESQCFRIIKQQLKGSGGFNTPGNIENEALELSNLVLDALKKDDYRVLRQFKGNSTLTTYITSVIARKAVDRVRKKLGRNRAKENNDREPGKIPPGMASSETNPVVKNGYSIHSDGEQGEEIIIPDTRSNPEQLLMEEQKEKKLEEAVHEIIDGLTGEERLIIRMRFPSDEEEKPRKVEQIAFLLGITQKAVYKRIGRLMEKCREMLKQKGVNLEDLV